MGGDDFGSYDDRRIGEVMAELGATWASDISYAPPGGESMAHLHERVGEAVAEIAEEASKRNIVVVTHATPIKSAVVWAAGRRGWNDHALAGEPGVHHRFRACVPRAGSHRVQLVSGASYQLVAQPGPGFAVQVCRAYRRTEAYGSEGRRHDDLRDMNHAVLYVRDARRHQRFYADVLDSPR